MTRIEMMGFVLGVVAAFVSGCDEKQQAEEQAKAATKQALAEAKNSGNSAKEAETEAPDPCKLLTEAMVRNVMDVPGDVEIERERSKYSPHPICTYSWNTLSEEEQKKQRAAMVKKMTDSMKKGKMAGGLMDMASMGSEEAHLTVFEKAFDSAEQAQKRLDSIKKTMEKGIKSKVKEEEVEFKAKYEAIQGVGDKAYWNSKHKELSFAKGNRLYHVGAKGKDKSQRKQLSKKLAQALAQTL